MLGQLIGPEIEELMQTGDRSALAAVLENQEPVDIADLVEDGTPELRVAMVESLSPQTAARVFEQLEHHTQEELIGRLPGPFVHAVIKEMSPDDRTSLLEDLPTEVTRRLLQALSPEDLRTARQLLGYPEYSVGRLMTPDYVALSPEMTAKEAMRELRRIGRHKETLENIFLIDADGDLKGDISLGDLVLAEGDKKLSDLVTHQVASILVTADQEDAVELASRYDRTAIPVVDARNKLLGIVTADDLFDVAEEEVTEDIQKMAAVEAFEHPYFMSGPLTAVRKRVVWLALLFFFELMSVSVIRYFEVSNKDLIAIFVIFIPLVMASGGNGGNQTSSLVIRGLAVKEVQGGDWWWVIGRELAVGAQLGGMLGVLGIAVGLMFGLSWLQAVAMGTGLLCVLCSGTLVGSSIPFLMRRLGFDPAISSGPVIATLVDVLGLLIFFNVAHLILSTIP